MLSIRGNDFIARWAYEETTSSHTEHTRNKFFAHAQPAVKCENVNPCWAYAERISSYTEHMWNKFSSLAEHTRNGFHRWLSIRGNVQKSNISAESNTIFKISCYLGTIRFRFLQKNSNKNFHACVPLRSENKSVEISFISSQIPMHTVGTCVTKYNSV